MDGLLRLRLARDPSGRTRMVERRQCYPLTTTGVLPLDDESGALVYVQNAAGAVFGGDRLQLDVALGAGAQLCLSTPSATRLQGGTLSVQSGQVTLADGAFFESVPDMLIPHPGALHRQHTVLDMAAGSAAILAETLAPGRVARGERHAYEAITLRLQVRLDGNALLHDAATWRPAEAPPQLEGGVAAEGYAGMLMALAPGSRCQLLADAMDAGLNDLPGVYGGAAPLACGHGAVARVLAHEAPALREAMHRAWDAARRCLLGRPAPRLRK